MLRNVRLKDVCVCVFVQMWSLSSVSDQRDGGPRPRPLCAGHPGAIHRPHVAAGASSGAWTQTPTQPHPRDSAAGLHPRTRQHKLGDSYIHNICNNIQGGLGWGGWNDHKCLLGDGSFRWNQTMIVGAGLYSMLLNSTVVVLSCKMTHIHVNRVAWQMIFTSSLDWIGHNCRCYWSWEQAVCVSLGDYRDHGAQQQRASA